MRPSQCRIIAGSCLLATGLLANSGVAVAFADESSTNAPDGISGPSSPPAAPKPTSPIAGGIQVVRSTLHGIAGTLGVDQQIRPQGTGSTGGSRTSILPDPFAATARITRTVTGSLDNSPAAPAPAPAPASDPLPPASDPLPPASDPVPPTPLAAEPTVPAAPPPPAPPVPPATPVATVLAAAQSVVNPVATQLVAIPGLVAAPVTDVLTSLQNVITATNDAIAPLVNLPVDLASLFVGTGTLPAAETPAAVDSRLPSAAGPTIPAQLLTVRSLAEMRSAIPGDAGTAVTPPPATPVLMSTSTALAQASAEAMSARANPQNAISDELGQFFQAYGSLIIAASLSALFAAALPGILGIVLPTAAGLRIGYRQAKAGTTMRATGIARFAGSGPVGIVRSGSLVALRPRPSRATPRRAGVGSQQVA